MAYQRKTRDRWDLYVDYGQGYEYELYEYQYSEMRKRVREYRENCPKYPLKVYKRREKLNQET